MTVTSPCGHAPEHLSVRANGVRDCLVCKAERRRRRAYRVAADPAPLVYSTHAAQQYAHEFRVDRPLENIVREALMDGKFRRYDGVGLLVEVQRGVVAVVTRQKARFSGRRSSWLITGVRRASAA